MMTDEIFQELLFGGLNDNLIDICRAWVDESKRLYCVSTDQEVIAEFSDREILPILIESARLFRNKTAIWTNFVGIPTPLFEMHIREVEGNPVIVIHEGFIHLLKFLNEVHFARALQTEIWDHLSKKKQEVLGGILQNIEYASLRIAISFLAKPFRLPSFYGAFPANEQSTIDDEIVSMLAFALYHEIGHYELGHHSLSSKGSIPSDRFRNHDEIDSYNILFNRIFNNDIRHHYRPESNNIVGSKAVLTINEELNLFKIREFEADEYAMRAVGDNGQSYYAGVALFLNHLSFIEQGLKLQDRRTHPFTLNRLNHIKNACSPLFSDQIKALFSATKTEIERRFNAIQDIKPEYDLVIDFLQGVDVGNCVQYVNKYTSEILDLYCAHVRRH